MRFLGAFCSHLSALLFTVPSGCERRGGDGGREAGTTDRRTAGRTDGAVGRSSRRGLGQRQLFSAAAVGGSRGDRDRCGSPSQGRSGKAGSGVCSQAGNHPRPPNKSPREAGPAPGLREEAAGDSAISRGLRGSGSRAGYLSYGALRTGEREVAWTLG